MALDPTPTAQKPLNLGLNDGTYCPQAVIDLLQQQTTRTALRNYPSAGNDSLRRALAEECGCTPDHIYLAAGSGPILKQASKLLIEKNIRASLRRMIAYKLGGEAYPIITPSFTYFKVPLKGAKSGLKIRLIPLRPEDDFELSIEALETELKKGDGLVYLATPNNPTGNLLITREQLEPLLTRYPGSTFWIDEAYVQYVSPGDHQYLVDLVPRYPNMVCSRTFSFAYGMAALKVGYLVARPELIAELESQVTDYRIPFLVEQACVAALNDRQHLDDVRTRSAAAREQLTEGLNRYGFMKVYPSLVNFLLVQLTDGRNAKTVAGGLLERGVKIKTFVPLPGYTFDDFFRITIGTPEENAFLLEKLAEVLA